MSVHGCTVSAHGTHCECAQPVGARPSKVGYAHRLMTVQTSMGPSECRYKALFLHPCLAINIIRKDCALRRKYPLQIAVNAQYFLQTHELWRYCHRQELFEIVYSDPAINVAAQKHASEARGVL